SRFYDIPKSSELLHSYNQYKSNKSARVHHHPVAASNMDKGQHYSLTKVDLEDGQTACDDDFSGDTELKGMDRVDATTQQRSIEMLFSGIIEHLSASRNALLYEFTEVRKEFLLLQADVSSSSLATTVLSVPSHIESIVPMMNLVEEEKHLIDERQRLLHSLDGMATFHTEDEVLMRDINEDVTQLHLLKLSIREETMRLSLRNVGARIAYMHRLSILVEYIATYRHALTSSGQPFNVFYFAYAIAVAIVNYFIETCLFWKESIAFLRDRYRNMTSLTDFARTLGTAFVNTYGKGIKVSIAATIASSLMLYKALPFLFQGGLWMTLVTILIKQDLASSSFLTSVQRLEGTVVGAMYALLVYQIFSCGSVNCDGWVEIPSLVFWVAVCGLFRSGPQHGYSATVASFTPILLLLGTADTEAGAWGRIEETFIGIAIYLAVDNLILPQRTYPAIKASVICCIDAARYIFSESVKGVEILVKIENSYSADTGGQWATGASANEKDDMGMYGAAADVRLRSDSVTYEIMEGSYKVRKLSSVSLISTNSAEGGIEMNLPTPLTDPTAPKAIQELLERCTQHFHDAEQKLRCMKTELTRQATLLNLVQFEPELWHRSFPQAAYQRLLDNFQRVYRSGVALNSGSKAFTVILCQMMRRNENISHHLSHFKFMISHLFLVSAKSDEALQKAHEAFKLLYAEQDGGGEDVDASSLLSLRRVCDKLFEAVDDHFRTVYMRLPPEALITFNPYFLAAWQVLYVSNNANLVCLSSLSLSLSCY
ncbi:FUSC family protein, partial [archaeon]